MTGASSKCRGLVCAVAILAGLGDQAAAQAPAGRTAQAPPGGAAPAQETHGDWRVSCAQQNGQKGCIFLQQLSDPNTRQLVMGLELKAVGSDQVEGTLVLPFGLAVDKPVTLQVDDSGPTMSRNFKTCVAAGCLVLLTFEPATVSALRKGSTLNIKVIAADGKEGWFKLSLNGFGSALDRTLALSK
jgi:invasion protein IalB